MDKELNNFQVYLHSIRKKHYTRKECTECMYNQRKKKTSLMKDPDYIYKDNPNYKKCYRCTTWKVIESYLAKSGYKYSYCYECRSQENKEDLLKNKISSMGGERYYDQPNKYYNNLQKTAVFNIMKVLNWKFNEEKGIWYKPGIKDKNNKWVNVSKNNIKKQKFKSTTKIVEKIIFMRKKGEKIFNIALECNCGETTVGSILKKHNLR